MQIQLYVLNAPKIIKMRSGYDNENCASQLSLTGPKPQGEPDVNVMRVPPRLRETHWSHSTVLLCNRQGCPVAHNCLFQSWDVNFTYTHTHTCTLHVDSGPFKDFLKLIRTLSDTLLQGLNSTAM